MRLFTLGFIICQITAESEGEKFGARFPPRPRNHGPEILERHEPRFRRLNQQHSDRDYSNYEDRITRKELDLPVTFKAPPYDQPDYWKNSDEYQNRRTFFGDYPHDPHGKPFQGLFQLMSSVFGGRDEITSEYPEPYHYNHNRAAPPYVTPDPKYVTPYRFTPTEPNYIPPPKPIRASVIKLETITRSPIYSSFEYETTPKYYPPVKAILNQVLIENSKPRENLSWYPEEPAPQIIPPFKPLPVLPKPDYVPPTTLKPTFGGFYPDQAQPSFDYYNKTDYKYPESVQDQLPHLTVGDVRIPYVSEKSIPQIFHSAPTDPTPGHFFPPSEVANNFGSILNSPGTNRRERPINLEFSTTVKSFPGAVEKVKRPTNFKYTKKLTAQLDKAPVERVTNLTVLGYSKPERENVNTYKQVNYVNVGELINYEMGKLENDGSNKQLNNSSPPIYYNDELSLDAKILKDTNWDGLIVGQTTTTTTTTTEVPKETTTIFHPLRRTESKPSKTAFWEIIEGQNTDPPSGSDIPGTTATEQTRRQTTTEFFWPSTTDLNEPVTTDEPTTRIIPRKAERRSENSNPESYKPVSTEEGENPEVTIPSERTTFKRRYSRRPKIVNFTPYPTGEELQKKLANRNYFPKRPKPNITLAFGNKNVLKTQQQQHQQQVNFGKDEVMKFSDEDVRKRRKIEKRRRVYKRVRVVPTSERPVSDESQ